MMSDTERAERLQDLATVCTQLRELVQRVREGAAPKTEAMLQNISRHSQEVARQAFGYVLGDSPEFTSLRDGEIIPGVIALGVSLMTRVLFAKGEPAEEARDLIHGSVDLAFRTAVLGLVAEDALQAIREAVGDAQVDAAVREAQGLGSSLVEPGKGPSAGKES